jgi:SagB-type dehydrogenase family enzyme
VRIRSARTLVFTREAGEIVAFNYLANSAFACSHDLLAFLALLDEWTAFEDVAGLLPGLPPDEIDTTIDALIGVNALTEEDSPLAEAEAEFRQSWKWGLPSALFHFSIQDKQYVTLDEMEKLQREKLAEGSQPELYLKNDWANGSAIKLPSALNGNDLLRLMARRRTVRSAEPAAISLAQLSDCLFAGLGITGETENCVGALPLSMTPSGGARNPYEAYVYARSVEGLDPGFYHYSAFDHTLARIDGGDTLPKPSELLGGQAWTDEMPCLVILCALFERTMWKYDDANAYRVVLIEAGHIGQNFMLAATRHGLSACPSAALNHTAISRSIGAAGKFTHAPIYALTLARPASGLQ